MGDQPLVVATSVIAPASQETLIPLAAGFHIRYGDERLRPHAHQGNNSHPSCRRVVS